MMMIRIAEVTVGDETGTVILRARDGKSTEEIHFLFVLSILHLQA